ncbi:MAG: hypothetical protein AUJ98_03510 [Bacteroidetes bacterium CG2_30_33_31]|nr:MAG: hypothetical protein AUJ98_03510 [Bacteroidetes bacterium CG2_30_33_31]
MGIKLKLLTFFVITSFWAKAQLSGNYTIGGSSPNYSTFTAAVNSLNNLGISGNVVFNVAAATYNENIVINNFAGNSTYSVTFKSTNNDSTSVILSYPSGTSATNNYTVKFNQAKNIYFQSMTLQRAGVDDYSTVVEIANSSTKLNFKSLIIKNNSTASAGDYSSLVIGKNTNLSNLSNFNFSNNRFENGTYGIFLQGLSSGTLANNLSINNNLFSNQYRTTIYAAYQNSPVINNNLISSSSTYYNFHSIDFLYCNSGVEIIGNQFNLNSGEAIYIVNSQGSGGANGMIFNNFIALSGNNSNAMTLSNSGSFHIYFNSINMYGGTATGCLFTGSNTMHNYFANNILNSPTSAKLMLVSSTTTTPFDYCDYNDYKTAGYIGDWKTSTNISSLATWKSTSNVDAFSISANPNFISNTNLHIQSSAVQRAGTSALTSPSISVDFDGKNRHYINPDMGAHELSFDDLKITKSLLEDQMCISKNYSLKITIKNISNHNFSIVNLPVYYKFKGNIISELKNISNLSPNDSIEYIFLTKINASPVGNYNVSTWLSLTMDANPSNDSSFKNIMISPNPVINMPIDTSICAGNSVTLSPGTAYDAFLWSTGDTTSFITLDTSAYGIGGKFISVTVTKFGCQSKDSTLVVFKNCTGFEENYNFQKTQIYPNPTTNFININCNNGIKEFEIRDISGKVLINKSKIHENIDVSALEKGIYFVILYGNNSVFNSIFIKQ